MSVLGGEVRKLLWWRNLLGVLAIGGLYYWVLVWGYVQLFPGGHPATESHQFAVAWHDEFGPRLEPADIEVIWSRLTQLERDADQLVAGDPTLVAEGVTTWRDTRAGDLSPEAEKIVWDLLLKDDGLGWKIQAIESDLEFYRPAQEFPDMTPVQLDRVRQINRAQEWRSLQSSVLLEFLVHYVPQLSGLLLLVGLLVAGPLVTGDRVNRVRPVQATTRTGRRLLRTQLAATVLVTTGLTAVLIGLTSWPLTDFGFATFWSTPIQSFTAGFLYPAVTLGEYCGLLVALLLMAGILGGLIGFVLSRFNRSYPVLALTLMAALAVGIPALSTLLGEPIGYDSLSATLTGSPFVPLITLAALTALALTVALVQVHRERGVDIEDM